MTKIIKIEDLFGHSTRRVLSDSQLEPDPELVAQGWERRFTADPQRAQEAMELYAQLGYEVRVESVRSVELADDCEDCLSGAALGFKTIYTRKKRS
jgi:hypothetical protein